MSQVETTHITHRAVFLMAASLGVLKVYIKAAAEFVWVPFWFTSRLVKQPLSHVYSSEQ